MAPGVADGEMTRADVEQDQPGVAGCERTIKTRVRTEPASRNNAPGTKIGPKMPVHPASPNTRTTRASGRWRRPECAKPVDAAIAETLPTRRSEEADVATSRLTRAEQLFGIRTVARRINPLKMQVLHVLEGT